MTKIVMFKGINFANSLVIFLCTGYYHIMKQNTFVIEEHIYSDLFTSSKRTGILMFVARRSEIFIRMLCVRCVTFVNHQQAFL